MSAPDPDARERKPLAPPPLRLSGGWLAEQGRLPLAFMGLALAWLAVAAGMAAASPGIFLMPYFAPPAVALTHAWVLGFLVTAALGAIYQIGPVALGTTLANERHGWWHWGLHAAGVPGMVYSFLQWDMKLLGHFGSLVGLGILLFAINTWKTIRRSGQRGPVAWSMALAAGWLLLTAMAGLTLAANRFWHFIPLDPLALLRAHAHAGLIGFFVSLLQGVSFQLVPMFTLGQVDDWRAVKAGLWLSQTGLIVLTAGLLFDLGRISIAGGAAIVSGMIVSACALQRSLATRKKRALDPGVVAFLAGGVTLVLCALLGLVLIWSTGDEGSAAMTYAVFLLAGGLVPAVAGMLCKIVPFLTWMRAYGPKVGRMRTPAAGALSRPRVQVWAFRLQGIAVLPLLAGVWWHDLPLLQIGTWTFAGGVILFLADMLAVLKHLWRPVYRVATVAKRSSP